MGKPSQRNALSLQVTSGPRVPWGGTLETGCPTSLLNHSGVAMGYPYWKGVHRPLGSHLSFWINTSVLWAHNPLALEMEGTGEA